MSLLGVSLGFGLSLLGRSLGGSLSLGGGGSLLVNLGRGNLGGLGGLGGRGSLLGSGRDGLGSGSLSRERDRGRLDVLSLHGLKIVGVRVSHRGVRGTEDHGCRGNARDARGNLVHLDILILASGRGADRSARLGGAAHAAGARLRVKETFITRGGSARVRWDSGRR